MPDFLARLPPAIVAGVLQGVAYVCLLLLLVIYWSTFQTRVPMKRFLQKVRSEMRPGSLFISNTFVVPQQPPERKIQIEDLHCCTLYIWRM